MEYVQDKNWNVPKFSPKIDHVFHNHAHTALVGPWRLRLSWQVDCEH